MEVFPAVGKVDESTRKVSRLQGKLTEMDGRSPLHRKLVKFDGRSPDCTECLRMLTEGLPDAQKLMKVLQTHGKLRDVLPAARNVDGI